MTYQSGVEARPGPGRPKGARNRRTQVVLDLIQGRGDKDPLDALSEIVTKNQDASIVATAANILAPYIHSKRGTIQAPRFVEDAIAIPDFTNIQQAQHFLADIARRAGAGELELASANDISNLVKNWILSVTAQDELQLKISKEAPQGPIQIHIEGGLPSLPGCNIAKDPDGLYAKEPMLNINHNGHIIDHVPNDSINGPACTPCAPQDTTENANTLQTLANDSAGTNNQ